MSFLTPAERASQVLSELASAANRNYIGESVSQLNHALQCAHFAQGSGAPNEEVLAALLHDIGHIVAPADAPQMEAYGVAGHEMIGADHLRALGFGEGIVRLIEEHVQAKRYLVAKHPAYAARMSAASRRTLDYQKGPMTPAEVVAFEARPDFKAILRLRHWDEQARVRNLNVAPLESYRMMLVRHLRRTTPRRAPQALTI